MDYKEMADKLRNNNIEDNCHDCALGYYAFEAATAITDLLARAEAAEAEKQKLCEEADHLKDLLKEAEARAEKAEKCITEIKIAREHTRPAYVVDQILAEWFAKEE